MYILYHIISRRAIYLFHFYHHLDHSECAYGALYALYISSVLTVAHCQVSVCMWKEKSHKNNVKKLRQPK